MLCDKCGMPHMIEDSTSGIEVYRCWVCGNRMYVNHPKRSGLLTCSKCGRPIEEKNVLNYCTKCWDDLRVFKKEFARFRRAPQGLRPNQTKVQGKEGVRRNKELSVFQSDPIPGAYSISFCCPLSNLNRDPRRLACHIDGTLVRFRTRAGIHKLHVHNN